MLALIDGDIVSYRCAASAENDELWVAIARAVECIDNIALSTGATKLEVWLSDNRENTFRKQMYPEYKANRTQPSPQHLQAVKDFLREKYNASVAVGEEADDALGYRQMESEGSSIICSIDKDLLQIPGQHFNFVRLEHTWVDYIAGARHFYKQMLIGDTVDNIKGVYGIGKVKASKLLDHVYDEVDMFVGHSCGGGFLVRWLSENKIKVGPVILVAPWMDPAHEERDSVGDFFDLEIDSTLSDRTDGVTIFISNDDDKPMLDTVELLEQTLKGYFTKRFEDKGHFCISDGVAEFPELLEEIVK